MKNYKKIINLLLCFTMLSTLMSKKINAIGIIDNTVLVINSEIVEEMLVDSGYSGNNFETYTLYNNENIPSYTLGVSENGYIIVENTTFAVHEYGEGNPYENGVYRHKDIFIDDTYVYYAIYFNY